MITIEYRADGIAVSDFHAERAMNDIVQMQNEQPEADFWARTSTHALVYYARIAIAEERLDHTQLHVDYGDGVVFTYNDVGVPGRGMRLPDHVLTFISLPSRLLEAQGRILRRRRNGGSVVE